MTYTRSLVPLVYDYHISGVHLERVTSIRDLGVKMDSQLTFNPHIEEMCGRASKFLGFVLRQTARFENRNAIISIYFAFVRSVLEYNSVIWDPHEEKYTIMLERVQRRFARYLYKKMYGYYPFLYPSLFVAGMVGIHTLKLRRKCAIMTHYYLLLNGKLDNPCTLERILFKVIAHRSRRPQLLCTRLALTATSKHAPTPQAVALINAMIAQHPDVDVFFTTFKSFVNLSITYLSLV